MARRLVFACQFGVGKATASDLRHSKLESLRVVCWALFSGAIVVTKNLFVNVLAKMKRLYSNVGSAQRSLEQRPEVLHAVDMDTSTNVCLSLVNVVMHESPLQAALIGYGIIGIQLRSVLNVLEQFVLQGLALDVRHDSGANFAQVPVKDALHDSLIEVRSSRLDFVLQIGIAVHVLNLAADVGFIRLDFRIRTTKFSGRPKRAIVQRSSQTLKHEPCRLLRNAKRAVNLHTGDSVLAIDQHPKACHPLVETDRRILKDRIDLERELLVAATTEPNAPRLDEVIRFRTATGAMDLAIRPAQANGIIKSPLRIGEVNNGLL